MEKQTWILMVVFSMISFGAGSLAQAEMQSQVSVDQPTCCEPCHVTTNCKSPESPDRISAFQGQKTSGPGFATDANQ